MTSTLNSTAIKTLENITDNNATTMLIVCFILVIVGFGLVYWTQQKD